MKYNFDEEENSDDDAMIVSGVPVSMRDQSDDDDFNANDDDDDEAVAKADSDSDDGFAARIKKKLQAEKAAVTKKAVPEKKY